MDSILTVTGLGVSFGGIKALDQVDFAIPKSSITAIIGPNGAGKTTVFNCLTGFYKTDRGIIEFHQDEGSVIIQRLLGEGLSLRDLSQPKRLVGKLYYKLFGGSFRVARLGIARTFQNIRLFKDMTVLENLLVAQHSLLTTGIIATVFRTPKFRSSESSATAQAFKWLDIVGLKNEHNRLAKELPYGFQRRLEIARAMLTGAKLICLDEPAAGLNNNETEDLSKLIVKLKEDFGVTICVIEHDMSLVMQISDHVIVLDHGSVIANGKPEDIKSDPEVLKAYLGED